MANKWIIRKDGAILHATCPNCHARFTFEKRRMWKCCPICMTGLYDAEISPKLRLSPKADFSSRIGDVVFVRGIIDEIRKDCVIVKNEGGYFGTVESEVYQSKSDNERNKE